jgi:mobilization protein NikA
MKENKDSIIKVRCTQIDKYDWQAKSKLAGLPMSELIRQSLTRVRVWSPETRQQHAVIIRHLAMIGNNINQISRAVNKQAEPIDAVKIIAHLMELEEIIYSKLNEIMNDLYAH